MSTIKNKEKNRVDEARVSEIGKHTYMSKVLYCINAKRLFKSFGVHSWGGGIGRHTDLMSQKPVKGFAGSNFPTKIPSPAH